MEEADADADAVAETTSCGTEEPVAVGDDDWVGEPDTEADTLCVGWNAGVEEALPDADGVALALGVAVADGAAAHRQHCAGGAARGAYSAGEFEEHSGSTAPGYDAGPKQPTKYPNLVVARYAYESRTPSPLVSMYAPLHTSMPVVRPPAWYTTCPSFAMPITSSSSPNGSTAYSSMRSPHVGELAVVKQPPDTREYSASARHGLTRW